MQTPSMKQAIITLGMANCFWALIWGGYGINFWLGMGIATTVLAGLSLYFGGLPFYWNELTWRAVFIGIISASILYGIFYGGNHIANYLFDFAQNQVAAIYSIQGEVNFFIIFCVLLFITSPAEEIFWRGFLQRWAMIRFGGWQGWLLSGSIYGLIHLWSGNVMLVLAAFIAGLFWGFIYWRERNLIPCIISHILWTIIIFVFYPIGVSR